MRKGTGTHDDRASRIRLGTTRSAKILSVLVLCLALSAPAAAGEEIPEFGALLGEAFLRYAAISDYACTFHRVERIGEGLKQERNIILKFRKPLSVYMKWTEGSLRGAEAIFSRGRYGDKLMVHMGGWLGFWTMSLDPGGATAMKGNRHPITEAGIGRALDLIESNYRKTQERGEGTIAYEGEGTVGKAKTLLFRAVLPPGRGYYGHVIAIHFDKALRLPVRVTTSGWDNALLEDYRYEDVRTNVGLTERDFDTKNPAYGF